MNYILSITFELATNLIESILFFYLVSHCLELKFTSGKKYLLIIFEFTVLTICNFTISSIWLSIILILFADSALAFIFTKGHPSEQFFWGCCYSLIALISEKFILFSYSCFFKENVSDLLQNSLNRYISILLYLIMCLILVLLISHTRKYSLIFPTHILITFLVIILIGIIASESILSTLITLHTIPETDSALIHALYQIGFAFILSLFLLFFVAIYTGILYKRNTNLMEKNKLAQMDQHQFKLLSETNQFLRTWKHDNKNHLLTCLEMLNNKKYSDCQKYLSHFIEDMNSVLKGKFFYNLPVLKMCFSLTF